MPRSGRRENSTEVNEECRNAIKDILTHNLAVTLVQIGEQLQRRFPDKPRISRTSIARTCTKMLFSLKRLHVSLADRNRDDVKRARKEYARWHLEEGQLASQLVFIDESGFNLWTQRARGCSRI